ncbi:MAG: ATP-binding protein [Verrucomicrobia bacterium]|nr:ATP-binding protein [Verrucomicrobiota bacterium]MCH8510585.1 ATP-binding protein [Kiritimatiellia bacterium]
MSHTPLGYSDSLRIGTVDFVSADEIKVMLDIDAPDSLSLNSGTPRPFPRINGYVLIPSENGYLVGQVVWVTIERSQYPKRKGMQDFGLVDLPYPMRKLSLSAVGTLVSTEIENAEKKKTQGFSFRRGVETFPSVGDPVVIPTNEQLLSVIQSGKNRRVKIGTSPLADGAEVKIDPDRLFGRHLAVLGNTGSGKSCSVAGLIRWSIEAAQSDAGKSKARFIILDPNGEYGNSFGGLKSRASVKHFSVEPSGESEQLKIPLWFWNSEEWCAFTQAAPKAQRPVLIQALRAVRDGVIKDVRTPSAEMRRYLRTILSALRLNQSSGDPWRGNGPIRGFRDRLRVWFSGLSDDSAGFSQSEQEAIERLCGEVSTLLESHSAEWPPAFSRQEIANLIVSVNDSHSAFGGSDTDLLPIDPNLPRPFSGEELIRSVEANAEVLNATEHVETMLMRIRTLLSDIRMKRIIGESEGVFLHEWLSSYLGETDEDEAASVTIIDLSLVPAEVVHILTSVIARMTLETLQRYRRGNTKHNSLPTVLIMEEAHSFIKRYNEDRENGNAGTVCCQIFEKIAREGRKFGLGLVLSSQRPSELSPTVLSQCNTFLLHRISNDKDQELVHKLIPDNLRGLLRDLPSLPSQNALLLGWATELPVLVRMNDLPREHQPQSDDPDFWNVWTGAADREVDWKEIADNWQNKGNGVDSSISVVDQETSADDFPF